MIARLFWWALLGAIAVVVIGVQLDRQSRKTPALAASVPEVFRSSAQFPIAAFALNGEDPQRALSEAERLVRRRPLPAEHLRVLAQAQFAAGQTEQSTLTIQYAAQRGWREPLAQEAMLRLASEVGDESEAARRFAALFLRRDTTDALLEETAAIVLAVPGGEGRQTLTEIVAGGDRWHDKFLRRGARVIPPKAFVEIVSGAIASGSQFDCPILYQVEPVLSSRDQSAGDSLSSIIEDHC